jgi:hypothetical protein
VFRPPLPNDLEGVKGVWVIDVMLFAILRRPFEINTRRWLINLVSPAGGAIEQRRSTTYRYQQLWHVEDNLLLSKSPSHAQRGNSCIYRTEQDPYSEVQK